MKPKHLFQAIFLLCLIVGTVFILHRHQSLQLQYSQGPIFGTTYHIEYEYTQPLDSLILCELQAVDHSLSMFNESSTLSRINDNTSDVTDAMFRDVFTIAENVASQTDGAYDVTVAPLVNAWGFGFKSDTILTTSQIDSIMAFVGYQKVRLSGDRLIKDDPRIMLDFSSVAKGYAVDCVAQLFDSLRIANYMIEIGGEVIVRGLHPDNRPWKIGVNKPSDSIANQLQTTLSLTNVAMATSGNYRRFYVKDGRRFAHTIDPHTGWPVQHELLSATVLAPDCATADAFATAFMSMGMEKSRELLASHKELSAYFIYSTPDGEYATWATDNMKKYLHDSSNTP